MKQTEKITIEQCCLHYEIESGFIQQLDQYGLIEITRSGDEAFIDYEQLSDLEKYMHLHYDLHINMEGMDAIRHLLLRIQEMQQELLKLQGEHSLGTR